MSSDDYKTDEVFGISRGLPLNYVSRPNVDESFVENLTRDKHVVIHGSSKQGKTSLRKQNLQSEDYVVVTCSNQMTLGDLQTAVLKSSGYEIVRSAAQTYGGHAKISATFSGKILGSGVEVGAGAGQDESVTETTAPLDLDPADVNDIIRALDEIGFSQYVVLEDFHYLPVETQKDFAVSLKAFHENSQYCFIVIGVWLEENRLTVYNGDLTGRVVSINADDWSADELQEVVEKGAHLLNVRFDGGFIEDLLEWSEGSVSIVQEVCHSVCKTAGVFVTQEPLLELGSAVDVRAIVKEVIDQQTGRYNSFLVQFAEGFQSTELEMYRWLLHPVLNSSPEQLARGLRLAEIRRMLEAVHPRGKDLNVGNVTQALQSASALQAKKNVNPIILDYDHTNLTLNVVDRGFLIWLSHQDRTELAGQVGLPKPAS